MGASAAVLLSGGLDSTVLLHYVAKHLQKVPLYVLSFDYGQSHSRELEMARCQAASLDGVAEHIILDMTFYAQLVSGTSALVNDGPEVPDLKDLSDEQRRQPPTYVPNRNMVLLALGAAFAEARGCRELYYGAQAQDEYGYWDCTTEFVSGLNRVLDLNRRNPVRICAPFVNMSKSEEIKLGMELGVDFAQTWTCYRGEERPCGRCPTCVERKRAFSAAGLADPLA